MRFEYSEDHLAVRSMARSFARKELAPAAAERDATGRFDDQLFRRAGELGMIGMLLPQEVGGSGLDLLSACLVLEELGRVDLAFSWTILASLTAASNIALRGTPEQKALWTESWVRKVVRGEATAAGAFSEPDAGSDNSRIRTRAVLDGDEWVINGSKIFITNAGLENCLGVLVLCLTDRDNFGFGTFLVPTGTPGYRIGPPMKKMGLRASDTRELCFEDCRVPAIHRIGAPGEGLAQSLDDIVTGRIMIASTALGLAQECFELASSHAKQRHAFSRPISSFQYIQGMLTDMALNIELGRLIRDQAAWLQMQKRPFQKEAAMCKWFNTEMAKKAADDAVQIFGGMGFMDDCPVSRYYRDIRASTIGEGTTQIQRHVIARELGLFR